MSAVSLAPWHFLALACCLAVVAGVVLTVILLVNKNKNRPGG
ncbi:MAG TPA: hypothetical protein VE172_09895 [Stackebrandtia sp.]|jgi:negative regulator of sigma E activity|nr:hypothetical protein [Stackebrandtia sp.]HZE39108.1 hypothetical protein [Stackebrandtia sp.]